MKWQTQDYTRDRRMTVKEQIKYNLSRPWWKFLKMLGVAGFLKTEPACVMRLRDFTPFYWRTFGTKIKDLHHKNHKLVMQLTSERDAYNRGLKDGHKIALKQIRNQIEGKPVNDGINR